MMRAETGCCRRNWRSEDSRGLGRPPLVVMMQPADFGELDDRPRVLRLNRPTFGRVQVQRLMGHSDPKLTAQVYTHLDVEDLRSAIETMAPV